MTRIRFRDRGAGASGTRATPLAGAVSPAVRDQTHPRQPDGRDDVRTSFRALPEAPAPFRGS